MVDREKVIKCLQELHGSQGTMELISDTIAMLKTQPDIVRCRNCKNSGLDSSGTNGYWCSAHTEWHDENWFCADGERKEGR